MCIILLFDSFLVAFRGCLVCRCLLCFYICNSDLPALDVHVVPHVRIIRKENLTSVSASVSASASASAHLPAPVNVKVLRRT